MKEEKDLQDDLQKKMKVEEEEEEEIIAKTDALRKANEEADNFRSNQIESFITSMFLLLPFRDIPY